MDKYEVLPSSAFGFICRTCLMHNELFSIDEVSWEGVSLKEIILNWTSLEVEEYERLPKQMCNKCIKLMYQTYHFLSKCKCSEWTLKNIILKDEIDVQRDSEDHIVIHSNIIKEVTSEEYANRQIDYTTKIQTDSDNIDKSILGSDNIHNSTSDSDNENSLPDSENIDKSLPDCRTIDTNCSVTSGNDHHSEVKTEISDDEEMSIKCDPEEIILDEIQSVKSDITKLRAYNKVRLRQRIKARLLNLKKKDSRNKGPPYNCTNCDASFQSQQELKSHKNDTHKKFFKFNCEYCDSKYQNMSQLVAHTRIHTGEKPYRCTTCGDSFTFKSVLKRHMVRHMEVKPHRCRYCHKEFSRKHILDQHERRHTGKRLLCRYCGVEFHTPKSLTGHEKSCHPATQNVPTSMTENGYQCDVCGKVLLSEKTLNAHVLLHGPRNFKCKICQKSFTTNERLLLHLKMTHESTMFSCHLCDNKYRQKSGLIGHLETQHQANNYYCEKCGKKFVYKGSLNQHMRLHTGDTKYQCKECLRVCTNKRRLETHMRTHTGERPFACEICGKCFAEKANFHNHQKIHTRDRSYACNVCEKVFLDFRSLKKHISVHI